jgi:hypothetical protein
MQERQVLASAHVEQGDVQAEHIVILGKYPVGQFV